MDLLLALQRSIVVAGEGVPLEFRLHAGASAVELPGDHESGPAVALSLHDAGGALIARADGVDRWKRQQPPGAEPPTGGDGSVRVEPGETAVWGADLLAYLDPPA